MKHKIYITLCLIAFWGGLMAFFSRMAEVTSKSLSLNQFNNSEIDYQVFIASGNMTYINYFIAATLVFALVAVWMPAKT